MAAAPPQKNDLLPAQQLKTTIVYERNVLREVRTSSITFVVPFRLHSVWYAVDRLYVVTYEEYNNFFLSTPACRLGF